MDAARSTRARRGPSVAVRPHATAGGCWVCLHVQLVSAPDMPVAAAPQQQQAAVPAMAEPAGGGGGGIDEDLQVRCAGIEAAAAAAAAGGQC